MPGITSEYQSRPTDVLDASNRLADVIELSQLTITLAV